MSDLDFNIEFKGSLAGANQAALTSNTTSLTNTSSNTADGTSGGTGNRRFYFYQTESRLQNRNWTIDDGATGGTFDFNFVVLNGSMRAEEFDSDTHSRDDIRFFPYGVYVQVQNIPFDVTLEGFCKLLNAALDTKVTELKAAGWTNSKDGADILTAVEAVFFHPHQRSILNSPIPLTDDQRDHILNVDNSDSNGRVVAENYMFGAGNAITFADSVVKKSNAIVLKPNNDAVALDNTKKEFDTGQYKWLPSAVDTVKLGEYWQREMNDVGANFATIMDYAESEDWPNEKRPFSFTWNAGHCDAIVAIKKNGYNVKYIDALLHKSGASDADKVFRLRDYIPGSVHSDEKKIGVDNSNLQGGAGYLRGDIWGNVFRNKTKYDNVDIGRTDRFYGIGIDPVDSTYAPFGFNTIFPSVRQERIHPFIEKQASPLLKNPDPFDSSTSGEMIADLSKFGTYNETRNATAGTADFSTNVTKCLGYPVCIQFYNVTFDGVEYTAANYATDFGDNTYPADANLLSKRVTWLDPDATDKKYLTNMATVDEVQDAVDAVLGANKVKVYAPRARTSAFGTNGNLRHGNHNSRVGNNYDGFDCRTLVYGGWIFEMISADMQNSWMTIYMPGFKNGTFGKDTNFADGIQTTAANTVAVDHFMERNPRDNNTKTDEFVYKHNNPNLGAGTGGDYFANRTGKGNTGLNIFSALLDVGTGTTAGGGTASAAISTLQEGSTDITSDVKSKNAFFVTKEDIVKPNPLGPDGDIAGITDINFIGSSGSELGDDYVVTYSSLTSGVIVGQRLLSRTSIKQQTGGKDRITGFQTDFVDTDHAITTNNRQSKDRFRISGYKDDCVPINAMVIMNSNSPGMVGIDQTPYLSAEFIPETIFNIQATGDAVVRITDGEGAFQRGASVQLVARDNQSSSEDSYDPKNATELSHFQDKFEISQFKDYIKDSVLTIKDGNVSVNAPDELAYNYSLLIGGQENVSETSITSPRIGVQVVDSKDPIRVGYIFAKRDGSCDHLFWKSDCGAPIKLSNTPNQNPDFGGVTDRVSQINEALGQLDDAGYNIDSPEAGGFMEDLGFGEFGTYGEIDLSNPYGATDQVNMGDDYTDLKGNDFGVAAGGQRDLYGLPNGAENNTGYGFGAGESLNTGSNNTFLGGSAGNQLQAGNCNVFLGKEAGKSVTNGDENTLIGCKADVNGNSNRNIYLGAGLTDSSTTNNDVLKIGVINSSLQMNIPLMSGSLANNPDSPMQVFINGKFATVNSNQTDSIGFAHEQNAFGSDKVASIVQKVDNSASYPDGGVQFKFLGNNGVNSTLFTLRHHVAPLDRTASYNVPSTERPFAQLDGDLHIMGAVRFHDGTSIESGVGLSIYPGSGLASYAGTQGTELTLDAENLPATSLISNDGTFFGVTTSGVSSKISLTDLAGYVQSGTDWIKENQNHVFSATSVFNTTDNTFNSIVGYRAGNGILGTNHASFFGTDAGNYDVNPVSGVDYSVMIGYRAGMNATQADNSVFIGPNTGHYASGSRMGVFIGNSAGLNAKTSRSIGIGDNALESVSGDRNIELTVGIGGTSPYRLIQGSSSHKLNVGDIIGGDMADQRVSVGRAILNPSGTLDVRSSSSSSDAIQTWFNNLGQMVAYLDQNGNMHIDGTVQTF